LLPRVRKDRTLGTLTSLSDQKGKFMGGQRLGGGSHLHERDKEKKGLGEKNLRGGRKKAKVLSKDKLSKEGKKIGHTVLLSLKCRNTMEKKKRVHKLLPKERGGKDPGKIVFLIVNKKRILRNQKALSTAKKKSTAEGVHQRKK